MNETPRVLITGASSGIGRGLATELGRRGWRIAVTGRRAEKLQETAAQVTSGGGKCLPLEGSVTDPETVRKHYASIREAWGGLDWLILNAGVSHPTSARRFDAEAYREIFDTNVGGAINWLGAALPDLIAQHRGKVVAISSLAAWRGLPNAGAYSASKAALVKLLEATRVDLRGTGVEVVTVCPGFILSDPDDPSQGERPFVLGLEDGVHRILDGVERGKALVAFPWQLSCLVRVLVAHLPTSLYDRTAARVFGSEPAKLDPAT
jgi:NAD(P)-dependent dehydrogenase (short-subunit alcohol dehydrogenase family)